MSDTNRIPEKVLAKIQKLMAIAKAGDGRVNENEASTAASLAQQLAADYNMELAALELMGTSDAPLGGKREKKSHDRAAMYLFQRTLMAAIATTNFCKHFVVEEHAQSFGKQRKVKRHVLLGRDINVRATIMMYDYLMDTMDRLLPYQGMQKRGREALLWLDGCATRLRDRLQEKREEMQRETEAKKREEDARSKHPGSAPSGNALVLSDVYSSEEDFNNDYMNGWEPGTTARRRKEWQAGYEARMAEQIARQAEKRARLISVGYSGEILDLLMQGYDESAALEVIKDREKDRRRAEKPETEEQTRKRHEREERQNRDYYYRQARANRKYSDPAYQAGAQAGTNIGLDTQVGGDVRKGIK